MNRFFTASLFVLLTACTAEKLDGGSTGDAKGAGSIAANDISDAPLSGTIASQPFEPKTFEIKYEERAGKWTLSIDNYEGNCGSIKNRPPSEESMTVNVIGLEASKEWTVQQPIRYATLQLGVFMAEENKEPDTRNATSGTVILDGWDETPGATITGKLKLVADAESAVEGTFTAKVCPAR